MLKMGKYIVMSVFILTSLGSMAQTTMTGNSMQIFLNKAADDYRTNVKRGAYVGEHLLGDSVTQALNNFERAAIYYTTTDGAYPVEKEVIMKPVIYKKVKALDKFFTKSATNHSIPIGEAKRRELAILTIGRKLYVYDTKKVESDLKGIKDNLAIEEYLNRLQFQ